jgi:Flp pilus assembly protein TadG
MNFKCALAKARSLNDEGTILVMVALMLPILIGAVGLAIDVGNIEAIRRQEQAAAAAMAGAKELYNENGSTAAATAAQDSATQNGFTNGVNNVTVTVNNPSKSGPNTGSSYAVEVIVSKVQSTFFMGVLL